MDISGLSIQSTAVPARRSSGNAGRQQQRKTNVRGRSKNSSYEGKMADAGRHKANKNADAQRKQGGVDESRYVLSDVNAIHDTNKFGYRQTQDWEKENAPKACGVSRAKYWSEEVENLFRIQSVGWRDLYEYIAAHGEPEIWLSNGFISKVYVSSARNFQST